MAINPASLIALAQLVGLKLERFQERIVKAVHGPERECLILLPRGNGKTALLALIALHHLLTVEDARIIVVASSRAQAEHLFRYAQGYARKLGDPHVVDRYLTLRYCPDPGRPRAFTRSLEVWPSADPGRLHGQTYSLGIIDELQAQTRDGVYIAMASALHKRPDAKLITITTAGTGAESPLGTLRARALAQPSVKVTGTLTDARGPGLRMLAWELPPDADIDNPRVVKKVNPASWLTPALLAEQRERLPDDAFRRFIANQWLNVANHWLPPGAWQDIVGQPEPTGPLYLGLDLQGSTTAVVWVDERLHVGLRTFEGDTGPLEARELVRELAADADVQEVGIDLYKLATIAAELDEDGLPVVQVPQTSARMIPASGRLYRAVVEKRLTVPDDQDLRTAAANGVARTTTRGWRLDGQGTAPLVALAIALDACESAKPEPAAVLGWL